MFNSIPVFVLTGGPCGGKTSAFSYLERKLTDLGYAVITVSEAATELMASGISPKLLGTYDFQRTIMRHQLEKEERFKSAACLADIEKKVIICDRGIADIAAYTPPAQFEAMLAEQDTTIVDLCEKRYDGVLFLRSVAVDAPHLYSTETNRSRQETVEEARLLDHRTLECWTGHPHIKIIDNSTDFEGKMHRTFRAMSRMLGLPVPLEIERKYLVSGTDITFIPSPVEPVHITQYYLKGEVEAGDERIRMRSRRGGRLYYHTIKRPVRPGVRIEEDRKIQASEYRELLHRVQPECGKIEKIRYCFVYENQYFELDWFTSPPGLMLLEIELTEEQDEVILPPGLKHLVTDVTNDPSYSNFEIARRHSGR